MALVSDGINLYAGGNFLLGWGYLSSDPDTGASVNNVGYFDGALWRSMGDGFTSAVNALALRDGIVYAGGAFTKYGNATVRRVAAWDGASWNAVGEGFDNTVSALAATPSGIYAGGNFTNSGSTKLNGVAKWDGSAWSPLGSGVARTLGAASVTGIAVSGDDIYMVGSFNYAGGKPSASICRWNETLSFAPTAVRLLNPRWTAPGQFTFQIDGITSGSFKVDASSDLLNWVEVFQGDAGVSLNFTDVPGPGTPRRAYRVRLP
jgi:hypothetical protein